MSVTENEIQQAANTQADGSQPTDGGNAVSTDDAVANMGGNAPLAPGGIPSKGFVPSVNPTLTAAGASSPTNAAPGSFADKLKTAFDLKKYRDAFTFTPGVGFGAASVSAGLHAMDNPGPSNTSWASAITNADATKPTPSGGFFSNIPVSNGQRVVNSIAANLGDLAAATQGGPAGGAFAGIARVAQAQTTRQRQEFQDSVNVAMANVEMLKEQRLLHRVSEEAVENSAKVGLQSATEALTAPNAQTLAEGKTSDEIEDLIRKGGIKPNRDFIFLTGRTLVGNDPNGLPLYRSTYTVIKPGDRIKPTQEQLDFINKYNHSDWQPRQEFSSHDWYVLNQRAMNNLSTEQAVQKLHDQLEGEQHEVDLKKGDQAFLNSPAFHQAISGVAHTGQEDPYLFIKAYLHLVRAAAETGPDGKPTQNAQTLINELAPNWQEQAQHAIGGGGSDAKAKFEKLMDDYSKIAEKAQSTGDMLTDLQKKADAAHGEEAAGMAASIQQMLNDPNTNYTPQQRKTLERIHGQVNASAKASQDWEAEKKRREIEQQTAIDDDDVDTLVRAAQNYQLDPNKLYSMRKNTNAEFKKRLLLADPTWAEPTYKARYEMTQGLASRKNGSMGAAMESLNTFAGHTWEANELIATLQNTKSPLLNSGINELKKQFGNDKIQPYLTALEAARTEYMNFLNNQHALTEIDKKLAEKLVDENTSPAAAQAVLRQMAQTVVIRARSMNHHYQQTMGGKNIPGLLEPETEQILRNFGIDPQQAYTGKTITPNQNAGPQPPKGYTHSAVVPGTNITVYAMPDGSIIDAAGNKYDANGKRVQ